LKQQIGGTPTIEAIEEHFIPYLIHGSNNTTHHKQGGRDMKRYTLSGAQAFEHKPDYPERTARRNAAGTLNFDVVFQVWPNRASMARTIRMQQRRALHPTDWRPCVPLTDGEGY